MRVLALAISLLSAIPAGAAEIVFHGKPTRKVTLTADKVVEEAVTGVESDELAVTITRRADSYFWASRENKPLVRSESGSYVTFHAVDGSGYVRVYRPEMYELLAKTLPAEQDRGVGYMEHLVFQLGSVTYFGDKQ